MDCSEAVGDTGRVVGALTATESPEAAVAFVRVDACELERKRLVASLGRLEEVVDAGAFGLILNILQRMHELKQYNHQISSFEYSEWDLPRS